MEVVVLKVFSFVGRYEKILPFIIMVILTEIYFLFKLDYSSELEMCYSYLINMYNYISNFIAQKM